MQIKIKRLLTDAKMPEFAHHGDVGMDVFSAESHILQPGERKNFLLGFAMEFPEGYSAIVKDRSSMARIYGIHTMGGVYDAGYRGEYNAELINLSPEPVKIEKLQKIAQIIFVPVIIPQIVKSDDLSSSERGDGKYGSTGKF